MGAVIGGLVSFLFGLVLVLLIASVLWTIFFRVILPLGLIVLLGMGIYWAYEKISTPELPNPKELPSTPHTEEKVLPPIILEEKV